MPHPGDPTRDTRARLPAYRLMFPLAALFAILAVPAWLGARPAFPDPRAAAWHGHEMMFGFAMAVIAGFLATRPRRFITWLLVVTWITARAAPVIPHAPLAVLAGISFPVTVFAVTAPPLLAGAKRRENLVLPVLLAALVATDGWWWTAITWLDAELASRALLAAIDLLALLLLLVGGRALRAAAGGHVEKLGIPRRDHRQPRYELPLAAIVGGATLCDLFGLREISGLLCLGAALLTTLRVIPWQLHRALSQPSIWTLALGYLWLVPGLALKGLAQLTGSGTTSGMVHALGIGALGILTLVMMARTTLLRTHLPMNPLADIGAAALLISVATFARLFTQAGPDGQPALLWLAAVAWSGAFLLLLLRLWRVWFRQNPPGRFSRTDS